MKANELPERIYIDTPNHGFWYCTKDKSSTEYIRTDAFIEKAAEWLKEHKEDVETEDNGIIGWIPDYFIEDFKKYMKGE